jgi:hypothetical protein
LAIRPVSIGATLRAQSVATRLAGRDLERAREAIALLTDSEQLEAELAAVRADTQAEVSPRRRPARRPSRGANGCKPPPPPRQRSRPPPRKRTRASGHAVEREQSADARAREADERDMALRRRRPALASTSSAARNYAARVDGPRRLAPTPLPGSGCVLVNARNHGRQPA